jgi:uncharacterized protein YeaO (DUF488 family)
VSRDMKVTRVRLHVAKQVFQMHAVDARGVPSRSVTDSRKSNATSWSLSATMRDVEIKRVYDAPAAADGYRVLVDRLWPRGITKERAHLCAWVKEVAPSTELRKWFSHDASRMHEFRNRYLHELRAARRPELAALAKTSERTRVTLLYAAHDPNINHAIVLQEAIKDLFQPSIARP